METFVPKDKIDLIISAPRPTIYEALKAKLGREPTRDELNADVRRILDEALVSAAEHGKLSHQRRR